MTEKLAGQDRLVEGEIDESMLDVALEETFPASDPVALVLPRPREELVANNSPQRLHEQPGS